MRSKVTDWGTDTEALVATVREALYDGVRHERHRAALDTLAAELDGCKKQTLLLYQVNERAERYADEARRAEAELERLRERWQEFEHPFDKSEHDAMFLRAETAEAELERLRAERDAALNSTMHQENYDAACLRADEAEAELERVRAELADALESLHHVADAGARESDRLDRAVGALRKIAEVCPDCNGVGDDCGWCDGTGFVLKPAPEVAAIRRAALAEIEEPEERWRKLTESREGFATLDVAEIEESATERAPATDTPFEKPKMQQIGEIEESA